LESNCLRGARIAIFTAVPFGADGSKLGTLLKSESGGKTNMELVKSGTDAKAELKLPG
jgi:hypothetical protein